jgi:hypothetical protein
MSDVLEDLQIEIDGLRYELKDARKNVKDFTKRHFNGIREDALVFCLERAADIAKGCDLLVEARLPAPLYTLTRSLLESLFWICWLIESENNAQIFTEAAPGELKRIARKNLATGFARVKDRVSGEDKTKELLDSDWVKGIPKRLRIEDMAKASGLDKLYTQLYGPLSMEAHGNVFGLEVGSVEEELLAAMAMANVLMECINLVVKNWVVNRKQTSPKEIYIVLQLTKQ